MLPCLSLAVVLATSTSTQSTLEGRDVGVRLVRSGSATGAEFYIKNGSSRRVVLVTPNHPGFMVERLSPWRFSAVRSARIDGRSILLSGEGRTLKVFVPTKGIDLSVLAVQRTNGKASPGQLISIFGYLPKAKPGTPGVFYYASGPDELAFHSPYATVGGELSASLLPVIDDTWDARPCLASFTNDHRNTIGYGYGSAKTSVDCPKSVSWRFTLRLRTKTYPETYADDLSAQLWKRRQSGLVGSLPQVVPLRFYAQLIYLLPGQNTDRPVMQLLLPDKFLNWWEGEVNGKKVGSPVTPDGVLRSRPMANIVRSAWGMQWWNRSLSQKTWGKRADAMVSLALSSPEANGSFSTTFRFTDKKWLEQPADASMVAVAWWLNKYATDFPDSPVANAAKARALATAKALAETAPHGGRPLTDEYWAWSTRLLIAVGNKEAAGQMAARDHRPSGYGLIEKAAVIDALLDIGDPKHLGSARRLTAELCLSQNTWDRVASQDLARFGGFGRTSTDSTILDGETCGIATTLARAGAVLNRQEFFERGVAALKARLLLLNVLLQARNGLASPSQGVQGRMAASFGVNGTDVFSEWRGFDAGEGSWATTAAEFVSRYGQIFCHAKGNWSVGIDGVGPAEGDKATNYLSANPLPYRNDRKATCKDESGNALPQLTLTERPSIRAISVVIENGKPRLIAEPGFLMDLDQKKPVTGKFVTATKTLKAKLTDRGFEADVEAGSLNLGPVQFVGMFGSTSFSSKKANVFVNPTFDLSTWPLRGWSFSGGPARHRYSALGCIGTGADGTSKPNNTLMGVVASPAFTSTGGTLVFDLVGKKDDKAFVQLVRADSGAVIYSAQVAKPGQTERLNWDLSEFIGLSLRFQMIDETPSAWIGVSSLKVIPAKASKENSSLPVTSSARTLHRRAAA